MEMLIKKRIIIFSMFSIIELCVGLKVFVFQANGIYLIWWSEFVGLAYEGKDIVFRFIIE